jgi:hypothetical protein
MCAFESLRSICVSDWGGKGCAYSRQLLSPQGSRCKLLRMVVRYHCHKHIHTTHPHDTHTRHTQTYTPPPPHTYVHTRIFGIPLRERRELRVESWPAFTSSCSYPVCVLLGQLKRGKKGVIGSSIFCTSAYADNVCPWNSVEHHYISHVCCTQMGERREVDQR